MSQVKKEDELDAEGEAIVTGVFFPGSTWYVVSLDYAECVACMCFVLVFNVISSQVSRSCFLL